jgi:hypothetical protein
MTGLLFTLLIIAAILFLISIGFGIFFVLVQLGVIAQKALEPPASDDGGYSLDQSREVGRTEAQPRRAEDDHGR